MPRPPKKVKSSNSGLVNFSFLLDPELARRVDEAAAKMQAADPLQRSVTRTDALRALLRLGLAAYDKQ